MAATADDGSELKGGWGLILGVCIVGEIADSTKTFTADEVVTHLFGDEANLDSVDEQALSSENVLGSLGFSIGAFGSLECTQEMAIGPVPTFMSIDAKVAIEFDIMVSFSKSDAGKVLNFEKSEDVTWGNTQLSLHFTPEILLIVGVGVKGFMSLGISGGISIPIDLEFLGTSKDKTIGIAAVVEAFAQFLFFKASYTVYDDTMANVYSNKDSETIPPAPVGERRFLLRSKTGGDELQYSTSSTNNSALGTLLHGSVEEAATWDELFSVVGSADLRNTVEWEETFSSTSDDSNTTNRTFEYVKDSNADRPFPQSATLGGFKDGVVVPDSDVVIAEDIYSNPRVKCTVLQDNILFFRIGTVNIESDASEEESSYRSRVVIDVVDGDSVKSLKPVEFDVPSEFAFAREDMYDYEFDIAMGEDRNIFIMITGGLIPSGDNAAFSEVVNASLVSFAELSFDESYDGYNVTWSSVHDLQSFYETAYYDSEGSEVPDTDVPSDLKTNEDYTISYKQRNDSLYHLVVQPKILYRKTDVWGGGISALAFAFIHRSANSAEELLTNQASTYLQTNVISTTGAFSSASYEIDSGAFEIEMIPVSIGGDADSNTGVIVFSTIDPASSTEEINEGCVDCFTLLADGQTPYADPQISLVRNIKSAPAPASPQPWWGNSGYLVAKDSQLCHYTYDSAVYDASDFTKTRLDLDGCGTTQFVVNDAGDQIVYIDSFTPGYKYNPNTEEWELMGDPRYQISMTRAFTDTENEEGITFCKPYKFAALEYPADQIFTFGSTTATAGLLINQIEDASNSVSCLHAIKVPYVAKFEVTDCVSKNSFVMAGAGTAGSDVPAESFYVSMKNIGNLCIVGFTAVMYDSSGVEVSSYTVDQIDASEMVLNGDDFFGKNNVKSDNPDEMSVVVCDDPDQKVATMSDSKINGCIMPGEEFKYRVEFSIPETWSGSQTIRVEIINHVVLGQTRTVQLMCSEDSDISYKQLLHVDSGATYRFGDLVVDEIMEGNASGTILTTARTSFDDLLQHDAPVAEMEFSAVEFSPFGLTEDDISSNGVSRYEVASQEDLVAAINAINEGSNAVNYIYLTESFALNNGISLKLTRQDNAQIYILPGDGKQEQSGGIDVIVACSVGGNQDARPYLFEVSGSSELYLCYTNTGSGETKTWSGSLTFTEVSQDGGYSGFVKAVGDGASVTVYDNATVEGFNTKASLYADGGSISIEGGTLSSSKGCAIQLESNAHCTLSRGVITKNSTGILCNDSTLSMLDGEVSNNTNNGIEVYGSSILDIKGGTISGNKNGILIGSVTDSAEVVITKAEVTSNDYGLLVACSEDQEVELTIDDSVFSNNYINGLDLKHADATIDNSKFNGNDSCGIELSSGLVYLTECFVSSNGSVGVNITDANQGFSAKSCEFNKNGTYGVCVSGNDVVTCFNNCYFDGNNSDGINSVSGNLELDARYCHFASNSNGINSHNDKLVIISCEFASNDACGISVSGSNAVVRADSCTLSGNKNGLYIEGGTLTMSNGTVSENAGGIYIGESSTVTLGDVSIVDNFSKGEGAGVLVDSNALLCLSGEIKIAGNACSNDSEQGSQNSDIFIGGIANRAVQGNDSSSGLICLQESLAENSWIGIANNVVSQEKIAEGKDGYHITADDAAKFYSNHDNLFLALFDDYIVLTGIDNLISFECNGGSAVDAQSVFTGAYVNKPTDPKRVGYVFGGWYADEACSEIYDFDTAVTQPFILYALWEMNTYTVDLYDFNRDLLSEATFDRGSYITDSWIPDERTGYTYVWMSGHEIYNLETTPVTQDLSLTQTWVAHTYEIAFDGNGGFNPGTIANQSATYDVELTLKANQYTRAGYTFAGWSTDPDASKAKYDNRARVTNLSFENNSVVTLYAVWQPKSSTESFDDLSKGLKSEQAVASNMVVGASGIEVYDGGSTWDTIVFGEYNNNSVAWAYLGEGTNSTTDNPTYYMLSEGSLGNSVFNDNEATSYKGSTLQGVMQDFYSSTLGLSMVEQSIVGATSLDDIAISEQYFFPMSVDEFLTSYSLGSTAIAKSDSTWDVFWWTRTAVDSHYVQGIRTFDGLNYLYILAGGSMDVRPAFNLATSSVLFSSAAVGSKAAVGATMASCLTKDLISHWKLTLYDAGLELLSVETDSIIMASMTIDVSYNGASTGNSLSAVIVQDDIVLYYTTLIETLSDKSGTTTLTLPRDFKRLSQTIRFFVEKKKGDNQTDYASQTIELSNNVSFW